MTVDEAEIQLGRCRVRHSAAIEQLRDARAAFEAEDATSHEGARRKAQAKTELLACELHLEACAAELERARADHAETVRQASRDEYERRRAELHPQRMNTLRGHCETAIALVRLVQDEIVRSLEQFADDDRRACERLEELAAAGDVLFAEQPLDPTTIRLVIGLAIADAFPIPPPEPEDGAIPALCRAIGVQFRGEPDELELLLDNRHQERLHALGPFTADWLRPVPEPRWDDHSGHAERVRTAQQLYDEIANDKEVPCPTNPTEKPLATL